MKPEIWRAIAGYPHYEVSSHGRVRSFDRYAAGSCGSFRHIKGRLLKLCENNSGYLVVTLTDNAKRKVCFVHHLVAEAFLGQRPEGMFVLHDDDVKTNNNLDNLRYGSQTDNQFDSVRNGRHYEASKASCDRGHVFDAENIYSPDGIKRYCRACRRARQRAYRQRIRARRTSYSRMVTT